MIFILECIVFFERIEEEWELSDLFARVRKSSTNVSDAQSFLVQVVAVAVDATKDVEFVLGNGFFAETVCTKYGGVIHEELGVLVVFFVLASLEMQG